MSKPPLSLIGLHHESGIGVLAPGTGMDRRSTNFARLPPSNHGPVGGLGLEESRPSCNLEVLGILGLLRPAGCGEEQKQNSQGMPGLGDKVAGWKGAIGSGSGRMFLPAQGKNLLFLALNK